MRLSIPLLFPLLLAAAEPGPVPVESLLAPRVTLPARVEAMPREWGVRGDGDGWILEGPARGGPVAVTLRPATGEAWDFGDHAYTRIDLANRGSALLRVDARLGNAGAQDWAGSFPSGAILLPGESGTLGFPFNRAERDYDGPAVFQSQAARPDGHRVHWRAFDPSAVREVRLVFRSADGAVRAHVGPPRLAWPKQPEVEARLEALPYLDAFGQVRALTWPGKAGGVEDLRRGLEADRDLRAPPPGLNEYGGWADGPRLRATGSFRTEKVDGRWWLVDPGGRLFWSAGVNGAGYGASTPLDTARAPLFSFLPAPEDPLFADAILPGRKGARLLNHPSANLHRALGADWRTPADALTHTRLRGYGLNTLAAWSEERLMRQRRTPYTLITGVWWPVWSHAGEHLPEPFDPGFERALRESLRAFAWAADDPFCLGVFIDNELDWPDRLGPALLAAKPGQPARRWALERLREKHPGLAELGPAHEAELDALYPEYARTYFSTCRRVLNEELPGKLYLGCRTHRGPPVLGLAAAGQVDVFSVNRYDTAAGAHQLPAGADMPYLVSEFHFGAVDRGVPSPGLRAAHDQTQRGRAAAAYFASALLDPRCVGAHWFCWMDQSAAGRPGENHQVGFVDVAGRAYADFIRPVAAVAHRRHAIRTGLPRPVEEVLAESLAR